MEDPEDGRVKFHDSVIKKQNHQILLCGTDRATSPETCELLQRPTTSKNSRRQTIKKKVCECDGLIKVENPFK